MIRSARAEAYKILRLGLTGRSCYWATDEHKTLRRQKHDSCVAVLMVWRTMRVLMLGSILHSMIVVMRIG